MFVVIRAEKTHPEAVTILMEQMTSRVDCLSRGRDETFQVVIPMMMWETPDILKVQGQALFHRATHLNCGFD